MTTGRGIAIAGIWIFVASCAASDGVTSQGLFFAIVVATVLTVVLSDGNEERDTADQTQKSKRE